MKKTLLGCLLALCFATSCKPGDKKGETLVLIETDMGDIKVKLYNETPKHRDNFIKLVKDGFYNDLLFHRVIRDFMIQGGDPMSKNAESYVMLGAGDVGYLIPAEFRYPRLFHKRGALAAAREGDDKNPQKKSSGCQFYLVYGKTFSDSELDEIERKRRETSIQNEVNALVRANEAEFMKIEQNSDMQGIQIYMDSLRGEATKRYEQKYEPFVIPEEVREVYRTEGGTPWLDGNYTVFGEVTEGLDVIDRIQRVKTRSTDRPIEDIKMTIKIIKP